MGREELDKIQEAYEQSVLESFYQTEEQRQQELEKAVKEIDHEWKLAKLSLVKRTKKDFYAADNFVKNMKKHLKIVDKIIKSEISAIKGGFRK